ncbi:WD40/YVTN/BNR-like repeat-containing protein [Thermodesulfobacteriota bacterium]
MMKYSRFNYKFYSIFHIVVSILCITCMSGCKNPDSSEPDNDHTVGFHAQVIKHTDKLYDVSAAGGDNIWVVGYFGSIFHSEDNGLSWTRKNAGTNESLSGVYFINEKKGWIVGESGLILTTSDEGESWKKQKGPVTDQKLLKVQFINENQGWIVGTYGVIMRTEDGGNKWERLPFDEDIILNDLCFINSMKGWIAGEFGTILYTEDGGNTWIKQLEDEMGRKLFGIDFSDDFNGIAVGNEGVIYRTRDGGKIWELKSNAASDTLLKVAFSDNTHAAAVGLRGCFYATDDGGDSWKSVCPLNHFTWLCGLTYDRNGRGFAVGDGGKIFISNNNGLKWFPYNQMKEL